MKKVYTPIFILLAALFLAIAVFYFVTKSGSLPHYFPGYIAGSTHVHLKHGLAALIIAVAFGILAWFTSAKAKTT